jgi:hypothetical protein
MGTALVAIATNGARDAGCEWLHVDFEEHLRPFYLGSCGFTPTRAGLIALHRELVRGQRGANGLVPLHVANDLLCGGREDHGKL